MPVLEPVTPDQADMRLDRFLRQRFPALALATIQRGIRQRRIRINDRRTTNAAQRLAMGDQLSVPDFFTQQAVQKSTAARTETKENQAVQAKIASMLVAVTPDYFVLNKPAGLPVQGGTGVRWHLDRLLPQLALMHDDAVASLRLVHRLDRDTSGLLLIARGRVAAQRLTRQFARRQIHKYYLAITEGVLPATEGKFSMPIGFSTNKNDTRMCVLPPSALSKQAKPADTWYRQLASVAQPDNIGHDSKSRALVLLQPLTGRKHQLRVHLAAGGAPIVGDRLYGTALPNSGLCLHAWRLCVPDGDQHALDDTPATYATFCAPPPAGWQHIATESGLAWEAAIRNEQTTTINA